MATCRLSRFRLERQCVAAAFLMMTSPSSVISHEIENTHVLVSFLSTSLYQIDIVNDADWMWLQLHPDVVELPSVNDRDAQLSRLANLFATGVTVIFDGKELTPTTVSYLPPLERDRASPMGLAEPGVMRLSGTIPNEAITFQFSYNRVVDEYPITVAPVVGNPITRWLLASQFSEPFEIGSLTQLTRFQVATQYLNLGFTHILPKGLDHILFVLGLFLLSTNFKPILVQVTAFTVAHTLTLALTIYGVFALAPAVVEPLIALSIAYVAVENLVTTQLQPWRVALVFAFGLLHGMGFAGVLGDLGLPRTEFITALLTFNVGVEIGQLTIIAVAFAAVCSIRKRSWYRSYIVVPASSAIAIIGLYWTVERIWLS